MAGSEMRIGKLFGIEILLDWSWFIFFFILIWAFSNYFRALALDSSGSMCWVFGSLTSLLFFASILFHELAHSLVGKKFFKISFKSITLWMFGGVAQFEGKDANDYPLPSAKAEFWMSIAGPVSSFVLAATFFGLSLGLAALVSFDTGSLLVFVIEGFFLLAFINLVLAIFNLTPCFPMDGGRIFRSFLWWKLKDLTKATRITYRVGIGTALLLPIAGFFWGNIFTALWIALIVFLIILPAARYEYKKVSQMTQGNDLLR